MGKPPGGMSIKDAAWQVMVEAYLMASTSTSGTLPANGRQISDVPAIHRSIKGETHEDSAISTRTDRKGPLAHLTTLNSDGGPQVTVVWVGIDGEEFVMGHLAIHQKVRNIRRDPRVALSLLGYNTTQGMREYVVVYGTARVTDGGAVPLLQRLAPIYLGPGAEYPPASRRNIAGYVTRIVPARFSGIGPWVPPAVG